MTDHNTIDSLIKVRGQELYDTYDENEKRIVSFGVLPIIKFDQFKNRLLLELTCNGTTAEIGGGYDLGDVTRLLAVAVMDAANRGSQKMVV
jgi:hypothetical protein